MISADPSFPPLQETSDTETKTSNSSGSDTVNSTDVSQPLASVTVVICVPTAKSDIFSPVSKLQAALIALTPDNPLQE